MRASIPSLGVPLYALEELVPMLDAGRGTVLALDWRALRALGTYADYEARLAPGARTAVLTATPGSWVSLELLRAHYEALDSLRLDAAQIYGIGRAVGEGVHGTFLATLVRLAGRLGVSPWRALEQCQKLWVRTWRGGAIAVYRTAAQLAHVVLHEVPLCESPFFRASFAGALYAGIAPFGSQPVAVEVATGRSRNEATFRLSWEG